MPDRSSNQGLPDGWDHGGHAARDPFSGPGASDGYGAGTGGSHRAKATDGYGTGATETFGAADADALGARADAYGVTNADPLGVRADAHSSANADPLGARADAFGAANGDPLGARSAGTYGGGTADPFGNASDPFGPRNTDPFGPATTAAFASVASDRGTARPDAERGAAPIADRAADARGFLGALFDFGFTSFVTPSVIKVLYTLIVIGTVASALVFTIIVFKASVLFGFLMLVFGDPLFVLIVLAIYRIILEFFVVTFRVAEDIRALRERGDVH